jgi:hypothetical protein
VYKAQLRYLAAYNGEKNEDVNNNPEYLHDRVREEFEKLSDTPANILD